MLKTGLLEPTRQSHTFADRAITAAVTGLLGLIMLLGVGFVQVQAVHDAAHDTRHAVGFPCH